jgi:hypothetical protein
LLPTPVYVTGTSSLYIFYHLVNVYKRLSLGRHRFGVLVFFHLKCTLITWEVHLIPSKQDLF